ncbi:MAG: hypothetical protein RR614_08475 [Eubacterium sp.]
MASPASTRMVVSFCSVASRIPAVSSAPMVEVPELVSEPCMSLVWRTVRLLAASVSPRGAGCSGIWVTAADEGADVVASVAPSGIGVVSVVSGIVLAVPSASVLGVVPVIGALAFVPPAVAWAKAGASGRAPRTKNSVSKREIIR